MYNNLLIFLTAIFLFSMDSIPETPLLPSWLAISLLVINLAIFDRLVALSYRRVKSFSSGIYFKNEKRWSIIALCFYAVSLFLYDAKYFLAFIPFHDKFPALLNMAGLSFFFLYLALLWRSARMSYGLIFDRQQSGMSFVVSNIKTNLPIVLPWIALSFCYDLLHLVPFSWVQQGLSSKWGDFAFYIVFLLTVLLLFPPLVRRLWGCTPFPQGPLKESLLGFFEKQNFSAKLYSWPLFEGRVITAGVMGIFPGFRYVMITPALLESMSLAELEAVMVHEIGHVKKKHMLLYLLIIAGFSLLVGFSAEPYTYYLLSRDFMYSLAARFSVSVDSLLTLFMALPVLILMLLYFRYLFGYFIRNFERQADLQVFPALGSASSIISAFEKIAVLSGNIRDQPSWHHFGIGERVAYLEKCDEDPRWIERHHRKVRLSLVAFLLALTVFIGLLNGVSTENLQDQYETKYTESVLMQKVHQEPDNPLWLRLAGDFMQHKKMEKKALAIYDEALRVDPYNPDLMNNVAWLLLTAEDVRLRNTGRALSLARTAAAMKPRGSILDTLATAYWANSMPEQGVKVEKKAIFVDPDQKDYYEQQMNRFRSMTYQEGLEKMEEK